MKLQWQEGSANPDEGAELYEWSVYYAFVHLGRLYKALNLDVLPVDEARQAVVEAIFSNYIYMNSFVQFTRSFFVFTRPATRQIVQPTRDMDS